MSHWWHVYAHLQVDTASLIQNLHLRSCGLVVLSRGGVIDGIRSVEDFEVATGGLAVPKYGKEGVLLAHNMEEIEEGPDPRRWVEQVAGDLPPYQQRIYILLGAPYTPISVAA